MELWNVEISCVKLLLPIADAGYVTISLMLQLPLQFPSILTRVFAFCLAYRIDCIN